MTARILTQSYLKECFDYGPATGQLSWRVRPREHFRTTRGWRTFNSRYSNKIITSKHSQGYLQVGVGEKDYLCHRIIWCWMTGSFPKGGIDHEDHDRSNNKWKNLREASNSENSKNATLSSGNTSGFSGVYWFRRDEKWRAQIWANGTTIHLGYFRKIKDAITARKAANIEYGFHANHGL